MNIERNDKRKKKIKAALEKVNKNHGRTLAKLGEGVDHEFGTEVDSFIEQYRIALIIIGWQRSNTEGRDA